MWDSCDENQESGLGGREGASGADLSIYVDRDTDLHGGARSDLSTRAWHPSAQLWNDEHGLCLPGVLSVCSRPTPQPTFGRSTPCATRQSDWCSICLLCGAPECLEREFVVFCLSAAAHFREEHHLCDAPECLERKFVVFGSQQELKQHRLREHGSEMTKQERRAAAAIPLPFQVQLHRGPLGVKQRQGEPPRP
jgi:hypothetical protein